MLRIKDLPEGGGAEGGRQVWFKLVTEDGQTQTLALAGGQVPHFIAGLQRFADTAKKQREKTPGEPDAAPEQAYLVEEAVSFPAPGKNLILRFKVSDDLEFSFFLRPPLLKALLKGIVEAQTVDIPQGDLANGD
jgi:hypothetical protein